MSLITPYGHQLPSLGSGGGLLSSDPAKQRRQISRINAYMNGERFDPKKNRRLRKAVYKQKLARSRMTPEARHAIDKNPQQLGGPRAFRILLGGRDVVSACKIHDKSLFEDEDHFIHFSAFGIPGRPIKLDDVWIEGKDITLSPEKNIYTFSIREANGDPLSVFLDFTVPDRPTGYLSIGRGGYALQLQPYAVKFDVKTAANSGAYYSSGKSAFVWDVNSTEWKSAVWDDKTLQFQYDTVSKQDPFGKWIYINEAEFDDLKADQPFSLTADGLIQYTAYMDGSPSDGATFLIVVTNPDDVPQPPEARATSDVRSVFPVKCFLKFDPLGTSFTGAYMIPQNGTVYGVIGTGISPISHPMETKANGTGSFFQSKIEPMPHPLSSRGVSALGLDVTGLANMNPSELDPDSPTRYTDVVSKVANDDINTITTYYMDDDIRTTFVQAAPIEITDPTVKAIATDDPTANATYYKDLQVPYVVASLARSTLDEGKQCNAMRAQAKLKNIPTNSAVYKRHSDALYRHHFQKKFSIIQQYLDDQSQTDYSAPMKNAAEFIKQSLAKQAAGMPDGGDPVKAAENLKKAQADVDSLLDWATANKLFWAFELYYWCTTYFLPNLAAQAASGTSGTVARQMKSLTGTFSMLEGVNTNPNGPTFQQAFNNAIRVYMMISMIPQFVDAGGQSTDCDDILKQMLEQFYQDNVKNPDPDIAKEATNAKELAQNDFLRRGMFNNLAASMRLTGTLGSWANIVQRFDDFNERSSFYKIIVKFAGISATLVRMACVAFLILPLLSAGGWNGMSAAQKAGWIITAAGIALTFAIQAIRGAIRLSLLWSDLSGFWNCTKAFFGFGDALTEIASAASRTQSALAQWFVRTGAEAMEVSEDALTTSLKIFGRTAGELITNVVGGLLAGVNLILSAIDVANATDPLQKFLDSLMIISSGLQLLAIGASWLVSSGLVAAEGAVAVLGTVSSVCGPLAIAFAVVGIVVMIVMMFLDKDPPNPVQDFIDKRAGPAGLKMPFNTDIDNFNVVPPDSTSNSLNGISFCSKAASLFLKLGNEDATTPDQFAITTAGDISFYPDTCWCVSTDYQGETTIFTYALDSKNNKVNICLATTTEGKLQAIPPPAKTTTDSSGQVIPKDPKVYAAELARQQWSCTCMSKATTTTREIDGKSVTFAQSAEFTISQGPQFLNTTAAKDGIELSTKDPVLSLWTLSLVTMGPSTFNYMQSDWQLTTDSRDESDAPIFDFPTSIPLTWSINPSLPNFMQLDTGPDNGGTIRQVKGVAPTLMKATYTVTSTMTIVGKGYAKTAQVTITVADPNTPPPEPPFGSDATREKFAAGSITPPIRTPTRNSTSSGDRYTIRQDFDQFMEDAPAFFKWSPSTAVTLSDHYTASVAISRMQHSLQGSWNNKDYSSLFFPNRTDGPNIQSGDTLDYHGAANAYVAIAIGNGDSYARKYCNFDAAQNTTSRFNSKLTDTNVDRFLEWLQWNGSSSTTGGLCKYEDYVSSIKSPFWLSEKAAEQADGTWTDQSMEMFFHFLKLAAIGATDNQIQSIYHEITTSSGSNPALDQSGFADISPSTWRSYQGYLLPGNISASQLNVSNLGQYYTLYTPNPVQGGWLASVTSHADTTFLESAGYFKAPSGSCFCAGTRVMTADRSLVPIESVRPGDLVYSISPTDQVLPPQRVAYVSQPRLHGRMLYSYKRTPDVLFTATHPLCLGLDECRSPILGFVDVHGALHTNPMWAMYTLQALPLDEITLVASRRDDDEVLFDLVFEPGSDVDGPVGPALAMPTYVVQSTSGEMISVCSAAPNPEVLPATAAFILSFAETIGSWADEVLRFFPDGLAAGVIDYTARIRKHRSACARGAQDANGGAVERQPNMAQALKILSGARLGAQTLADSIEAIIGSLGLSLEVIADNGWHGFYSAYEDKDGDGVDQKDPRGILTTHLLQLTQPAVLQASYQQPDVLGLPASYQEVLTRLRGILLADDAQVQLQHTSHKARGDATVTTPAKLEPVGNHMFRLRSNAPGSRAPRDARYTLTATSSKHGTVELWARGSVSADAIEAKWPLYLGGGDIIPGENGGQVGHDLGCWHVGWLTVSWEFGVNYPDGEKALQAAEEWAHSRAPGYMWLLGREVGTDVLRSLLGNHSA